jgi:hypothetical protein
MRAIATKTNPAGLSQGRGAALPRGARPVVAACATAGSEQPQPQQLAAATAAAALLLLGAAPEPALAANDLAAKRNAIREQVLQTELGDKNTAKKGGLFGSGAKKAPALQARSSAPSTPSRPRFADRSRLISGGGAKRAAAPAAAAAGAGAAAALPSPAVGAGVLALALAAAGRAAGKAAATPTKKRTVSAAPAAPPPAPKPKAKKLAAAPSKPKPVKLEPSAAKVKLAELAAAAEAAKAKEARLAASGRAPASGTVTGPTGTKRVPKAAASGGTTTAGTVALRQAVRAAVVNEQNPDEPTAVTAGGVVGAALAVGALLVSSALRDAAPPPAPVPALERAPEIVRVATAGKTVASEAPASATPFGFTRSGPAPEPKAAAAAPAAKPKARAAASAAAPAAAKKAEAASNAEEPNQLAAVGAGVAVLALALATLGTGGSSSTEGEAAGGSPAGAPSSSSTDASVDPAKLRAVFVALMANDQSRALMRDLLAGAGLAFDEREFERQVADAAAFDASIAPVLRRMPADKLKVLSDLAARSSSDVSGLVASVKEIAPMAKELSGDVKQTIETIRATKQ